MMLVIMALICVFCCIISCALIFRMYFEILENRRAVECSNNQMLKYADKLGKVVDNLEVGKFEIRKLIVDDEITQKLINAIVKVEKLDENVTALRDKVEDDVRGAFMVTSQLTDEMHSALFNFAETINKYHISLGIVRDMLNKLSDQIAIDDAEILSKTLQVFSLRLVNNKRHEQLLRQVRSVIKTMSAYTAEITEKKIKSEGSKLINFSSR